MKPSSVATVLTAAMKAGKPVLVKSAPGLGKTSVAEQTAEALGYDLAISHPVVSDPTDFKGLPFAVDGHAKFLPYGDLERMVNADRPLVVLLDDLGQGPRSCRPRACICSWPAKSVKRRYRTMCGSSPAPIASKIAPASPASWNPSNPASSPSSKWMRT